MKLNSRRGARHPVMLAVATIAIALTAFPAFAYVGPGAGLTLLGALWGLVLAVIMSVGFVILWPFRKLLRRDKRAGASRDQGRTSEHVDSDAEHTMLANRSKDRDERPK